jgi:hypothetical protein
MREEVLRDCRRSASRGAVRFYGVPSFRSTNEYRMAIGRNAGEMRLQAEPAEPARRFQGGVHASLTSGVDCALARGYDGGGWGVWVRSMRLAVGSTTFQSDTMATRETFAGWDGEPMRFWITGFLALPVIVAFVVVAGPAVEEQRYSCHKCRNLKCVTTRTFVFVHGASMEREDDRFPIPDGHVHEWWRYSTFKSQGIGGRLGKSVECRPSMYKDGLYLQTGNQLEAAR